MSVLANLTQARSMRDFCIENVLFMPLQEIIKLPKCNVFSKLKAKFVTFRRFQQLWTVYDVQNFSYCPQKIKTSFLYWIFLGIRCFFCQVLCTKYLVDLERPLPSQLLPHLTGFSFFPLSLQTWHGPGSSMLILWWLPFFCEGSLVRIFLLSWRFLT